MDEPSHDPVDALLQSRAAAEPNASLQARLLALTGGVLRRRRMLRRAGVAAALAACFLAGATVAWLLKPPATPRDHAVRPPEPEVPDRKESAPSAPAASPLAQEWQAFDAATQRGRLFREAGDRYLHELHDVEAALRCYTQALDAGGDDALAVAPQDSWLLIALKGARRKERNHAFAAH